MPPPIKTSSSTSKRGVKTELPKANTNGSCEVCCDDDVVDDDDEESCEEKEKTEERNVDSDVKEMKLVMPMML